MKPRIDAHHKDQWADEIVLNGIRSLRLVMRERWKESELSGDEWRFSYVWQVQRDGQWEDLHGHFNHQDAAIASFYPAFRTSHPDWCKELCYSIQFLWKGQPLAEMSDDGKPVEMLHALGSVAWSAIVAREQLDWKKDDSNVCSQPGCQAEPAVLYRKKVDYHEHIGEPVSYYEGNYYRRFCAKHRHRGDCGLDDSDTNYEAAESIAAA